MRIGHGYDAHRFCENKPLVIGGVVLPYEQGLLAHSDGDVLIHALCDSLLGAAGLGDIGGYYPDNDDKYKGIDSRVLLRDVYQKLNTLGWVLGNADMTVIAQKPKMKPYIEQMKSVLAEDMKVSVSQLNIKATTTEGMGFTGRVEGISAHCVALLVPSDG